MLFLLLLAGCEVPSAIAGKVLPGETIKPKYVGMVGQSIGVMVWTDRGVQIDYPSLNLDLANSVQKKLMSASNKSELKGAIFPVQPASIARYVIDHPHFYAEVEEFGTRAPASVELYRGHMEATLKVIEISGDKASVVFEDNDLRCSFPPKVPEDGTPDGDDVRFYAGTVDAMSTEIINRLVSHEKAD